MSSVLDSVNQRTQLVGENRLELLLFNLGSYQTFAINVFKVQEVVSLQKLFAMPGSHPSVIGVVNMRGITIPVINLPQAIGMRPMEVNEDCNLIITEYNRTIQAFLVGKIDQIVNTNWGSIQPPPKTAGRHHYLTAITQIERGKVNNIVEIIDVEKVLAEIITYDTSISEGVLDHSIAEHFHGKRILIVDDSPTARNLVRETLSTVGLEIIEASDGLQALNLLKQWADEGKKITDELLMMITDAEMPEMDGYKLTYEIRNDERMSDLYIALNTSLSGSFNDAMVEKVGCNKFISKFQPDKLVEVVQDRLRETMK
ncbi:chemotaxis protein CheV [Psychrobium sp. 1_MG-2023]|uniref:chemotaxis protein CheV n=1 Tax=Psychrobium sp. 1_MG-2023 TaxID=3062624 RepID=UPI000C340FD6|nr:chemotaxis protein CheV [Psychrobium sp. 1_MG-2023]MDP2562408.1 chemotaxis protein CheV [Psychrobium sp. 1_MG-2023]PKF56137.1 chemotaxis protein CheW [Alteromonadales bacterium alter-6D02]